MLKYYGLDGEAAIRGEYFMVPVSFLAKVFGASSSNSHGGSVVEISLPEGQVLQFARGNIGCVLDNRIHSMFCETVFRDGELYVPIEWGCRRLFNHHTSKCEDVLYITDHDAELSLNKAHIIRYEILN